MRRTADIARHKWRQILPSLGIDGKFLNAKHGPCPWCGGRDRFRFDNKEGDGTFFCNQCGPGDGFTMLMLSKGWDFQTAAKEVEGIVGECSADRPKSDMSPKAKQAMQRRVWEEAKLLTGSCMASEYLRGRGVLPGATSALRYHDSCPVPHGRGYLPGMVALVSNPDGTPCNVHRTFLGPNGKAETEIVRAMMPGDISEGAAVRIYRLRGDTLGIAEGIETAIAAAKRFQFPVWSAINSTMLAKWFPPEGVRRVLVFADNDAAFGGQAAAYALAHRLAARMGLAVEVHIPQQVGTDWADLI